MKTRLLTYSFILAVVGLLTLTGGSALAQNSSQVDNLRAYLEATDDIIGMAREAVQQANHPVAEQSLQAAIGRQEKAWDFFHDRRYVQAKRMSDRAREFAKTAISKSRNSEQLEGVVLRRLERAQEHLDRLAEQYQGIANPTLVSLWESAKVNLDRGWEFYRNRQFRPALKLADLVEKTATRLYEMAQAQERRVLQYQRNREQAELFLDQSRERVQECNSEPAHRLLEQAHEALRVADDLARNEQSVAANQALKRVRDLTWDAVRLCQGSSELTGRYERLVVEADRLAEELTGADDTRAEAARRLLEQAHDQLDRARTHIQNRRNEPAMTALQAAQLALRQAQRYITDGF